MSGSRATEEELRALVAQDSSTLPALEAAMYEPESASNKLNVYEKAAWGRQNEVLRAYSLCRTKSVAARVTGVGRTTSNEWVTTDYLGFKDRLAAADEAFLGDLENLALNRVRAQKPGDNPTLLIMLLNGNLPDKYRPNSVIPSDTMTETLQAMKEATREFKRLPDGTETITETETVIVKKGL